MSNSGADKQIVSRPRQRAEAKAASRQALVQAAVELMPSEGLDVSLDRLCAHAGYTRGAFYQHFPDRDALLAAVMEHNGQQVLTQILESENGGESLDGLALLRRIVAIATGELNLSDRPRLMHTYQLLEACARSSDVRRGYRALLSRAESGLADAIVAAQKRGDIRSDLDHQTLARLGVFLFVGVRALEGIIDPTNSQMLETSLRLLVDNQETATGG